MDELTKEEFLERQRKNSLKYYYKKREDPEFLEKRRTYGLTYYHEKKDIYKQKALERYYEKIKDPEFAERERIRCREKERIKRLKQKLLN